MKIQSKNHKQAQSLIELLIALGIFALLTSGAVAMIIESQQSNLKTIEYNQALSYAKEGLEATRAIRDRNFLLLANDTDGIGLTTQNGYYEFQGDSETLDNIFTRRIFIEDAYRDLNGNLTQSGGSLDPNIKKITARVSWKVYNVSFSSYLTNWQGADWLQTTLAEFNQGTFNQTEGQTAPEPPTGNGQIKLQTTQTDSGFYSSTNLGNHANNVFVNGIYAYVAVNRDSRGFHIVDLNDINNPRPISYLNIGDDGLAVEVTGNYAYVTSDRDSESLAVVDISNPNSLRLIRKISISGDDGHELEIRGNYIYIANDHDRKGFTVVDISNRENPRVIAELNLSEEGSDIVVSGNYAYVAVKHDTNPLAIIDISNPVSPRLVRSFDTGPHSDGGIDLNGNYLYIAGHGTPDFTVVDISSPSNPRIVSTLEITSFQAKDLSYKDDVVYIAVDDQNNGMAAIDVSNPATPRLLYHLDINGKGTGTFSTANNVFITTETSNSGLIIIETTQQGFFTTGDYTSSVFDSGSTQTQWRSISWTGNQPSGSSLQFQIRTANSSNAINTANWIGPDSTPTTYYLNSPSTIRTDPNANGTQFIQFKTFFTSDGQSSPILDSVNLNYVP